MVTIMKNKNSVNYWLVVIGCGLLGSLIQYSIFHSQNSAATETNTNFKRKFLQIALNIPEDEEDKKAKNELKRIIEQIRSINLEIQKETFEPVIVPDEPSKDETPADEPKEVVVEDKDTKEKQIKELDSSPPDGILAGRTVQMIQEFSRDPNNLQNPFELAETLFLSGYLKEAAIFYKEALKRKSPKDADSPRDRAWILFQIGNCLSSEDISDAIKIYSQLITEYPDSPWKECAETRRTLLDWFLKEKPQKLIDERKQ
jgi:tetratricopeptide (TPR) repeat protein